jgi:hypothetical protein
MLVPVAAQKSEIREQIKKDREGLQTSNKPIVLFANHVPPAERVV